jgi:autotransporter-associated beta strand protein
LFLINSNQPFGLTTTSSLTIGNTSYINKLEAVGSDRTITKPSITINKSIGFQGSNSIALDSAAITMSAGPSTGNVTLGNYAFINNDITSSGKTVTLGAVAGVLNLNNNNSDLFRLRDVAGAGTTIIPSNIADNSGAVDPTSRMAIVYTGTGTLKLTGSNTYQGGTRITSTGTLQLGDGGTTGSLTPSNSITPVVNGTAAGTLVFNRTDAYSTAITTNGPIGITQKGNGGSVTLSNTQFNSGANTIGDGTNPSTLVVNGAAQAVSSTATNATVATFVSAQLTVNTVTLGGSDTTTSLGLKVGQPVYVTGSPSSVAYVDSITDATHFRVFGGTLLTAGSSALSFAAGSALGTGATTVNAGSSVTIGSGAKFKYNSASAFTGTLVNNGGTISGTGALNVNLALNSLASHLAPGNSPGIQPFGANQTWNSFTYDWEVNDFTGVVAGTAFDQIAITGSLDLTGGSGSYVLNVLSLDGLNVTGLAQNFSEVSQSWTIASTTTGITGFNAANWTIDATGFLNAETGAFTLAQSGNDLVLSYAPIPEPSTYAALAGFGVLGLAMYRRRRAAKAV